MKVPAKVSTRAVVAATPDDKGDDMQLFSCPQCAFTDESKNALVMHLNKVGDGPHPFEAGGPFPCPEPNCKSVRATKIAYKAHMVRTHDKGGQTMCSECLDFWPDRATWGDHKAREHSRAAVAKAPRRRAVAAPAMTEAPLATVAEMSTPAAAPPVTGPRQGADLMDAADQVIAIMEEYRKLKTADSEKDETIARLTGENEDLRAKLDVIQGVFGK
jgi:hypothetical protein